MKKAHITIVGSHGKHLSEYLRDHLKSHGIAARTYGADLGGRHNIWKVKRARTLICMNKEVLEAIEKDVDVSDKEVICLDISDTPDNQTSKRLTGDVWLEYQETVVYPTLEKQIKKHLKKLQ